MGLLVGVMLVFGGGWPGFAWKSIHGWLAVSIGGLLGIPRSNDPFEDSKLPIMSINAPLTAYTRVSQVGGP